jgi:hypothetical protein
VGDVISFTRTLSLSQRLYNSPRAHISTLKLSVRLVFSPVADHQYNRAGTISRRQYLAQVHTTSGSHFATPTPNTVDQSKTTGDAGGLCSGSVDQSNKRLGRYHCSKESHVVNDCWAI